MRDKRSELQKNIETEPVEEPKDKTINERDKLNIKFFKDKNIFNPKLRQLYNSNGKQTPEFEKILKKILVDIAKYRSTSGGESYTKERQNLKGGKGSIPFLYMWIEGEEKFKKFLKDFSTGYNFVKRNIVPYIKEF